MKNILLIEPFYKAEYPPLGLMKISTWHKRKGDNVQYFKGIKYTEVYCSHLSEAWKLYRKSEKKEQFYEEKKLDW